jgi:hypothetical protein
MIFEIRNNLSTMNCVSALNLSKQLFDSKYSDNDIRMLYASAHGCNVDIRLYPLLDAISVSDFTSLDAILKSLVRLFPSRTALDTKLQSTWIMQDVLQSILNPGVVIGASDQNVINAYNTGSLLARDRTDDGNAFLVFSAMAGVGTSLNRYGYGASDDPVSFGYAQVLPLTWVTQALIKADTVHSGCSLASSMMNMFDAINAISDLTSGSINEAFSLISSAQTAIDTAGTTQCTTDGFTVEQCEIAAARLRYRDGCFEQDAVASYAAGVIQAIEAGWL